MQPVEPGSESPKFLVQVRRRASCGRCSSRLSTCGVGVTDKEAQMGHGFLSRLLDLRGSAQAWRNTCLCLVKQAQVAEGAGEPGDPCMI